MRILILSCNTGGGHNAAGEAIKERINYEGHQAVMLDVMLLASKKVSDFAGNSYINTVKNIPGFFGFIYRLAEILKFKKRKSPVYYANIPVAKYLKRYLDDNKFDAIIATQIFAAEALTYLKDKHYDLPEVLAIETDYTCSPLWEETACDYFIIPHQDLVKECTGRGMDKEKILPLGIPVKRKFSVRSDIRQSKRKLNLPPDVPVYLIMSGIMGFGELYLLSKELVNQIERGENVIIICGKNKKIKKILTEEFKGNQRVHIIGYTRHVPEYMDACDVIFTKPGGLTSTEAAVKNIPIVHTKPIPGCETKNKKFFVSKNMSFYSDQIPDQVKLGKLLVQDKELRDKMISAQKENINSNATYDIYKLLLKITEKNSLY